MAAVTPATVPETTRLAQALLGLVRDVAATGNCAAAGPLRADCLRLARKVSLLCHLAEEICDFAARCSDVTAAPPGSSSSSSSSSGVGDHASCLADLLLALEAAKRFLLLGCRPTPSNADYDLARKNIAIQFQYVTWQLEKVLRNIPYDYFNISDEVQEEIELVCAQLRRAAEKIGAPNLNIVSEIYLILSRSYGKELVQQSSINYSGSLHIENTGNANVDFQEIVTLVAEVNGWSNCDAGQLTSELVERIKKTGLADPCTPVASNIKSSNLAETKSEDRKKYDSLVIPEDFRCPTKSEDRKKSDSLVIPEDFRCPISLELMRDPVIVSTGQTYERSFIQRWIDCGNRTCPKTQQKLQNLTLTPNYALRSLIMEWCETHNVKQPCRLSTGRTRKNGGSSHEIVGDRGWIDVLVRNLSSSSLEECQSAAAEIRSLAKRSTDNRILIAQAGAIPVLVCLLSADDHKTQEHAVTSLLNLSIHDSNKEIIMLAGAVVPIIKVLRMGSMEARENAAAAIFSLSLIDDNKVIIGSTPGAIEALVELLQSGSSRGRKDAATALFNLCVYQGNKPRAIRAGILMPLLLMLRDSTGSCVVDEALTILSVLVSHQEGKVAVGNANMIPVLIDLLRTGQPRNKENAAAILLALCKKDAKNLACIGRLGALIPLTELAKSGTDRAKRKATSLLEHLQKLHTL